MINGTAWVFSPQKFRLLIEEKIHRSRIDGRGVTNTQINKELSELIHVSPDAIRKWKSGDNAFSDETYIEALAQYFDVDKTDLLVPVSYIDNKALIPDNRKADCAEVNRVFIECLNSLFLISLCSLTARNGYEVIFQLQQH